jgi:hypothetical protein
MSMLSPLFPRDPVDVSRWLQVLPTDGLLPFAPSWRWVPTPGHVSLWRKSDRTLIAGDAVITTRQESAYAALMEIPEMHGPPRTSPKTGRWRASRCVFSRLYRPRRWSRATGMQGAARRCVWRLKRSRAILIGSRRRRPPRDSPADDQLMDGVRLHEQIRAMSVMACAGSPGHWRAIESASERRSCVLV